MNVKLGADGHVSILKAKGYVLTLDFLLKMIAIHERQQCGVPVVLSGETGVGKTFMLETMCSLYNSSHEEKLTLWRDHLFDLLNSLGITVRTFEEMTKAMNALSVDDRDQCLHQVYEWFQKGKETTNIDLLFSLINFDSVSREITRQVSFH